ncbi:hypothetical protein JST97_33145 [bacterium]|nr:hypothetical protein [bacterium]
MIPIIPETISNFSANSLPLILLFGSLYFGVVTFAIFKLFDRVSVKAGGDAPGLE